MLLLALAPLAMLASAATPDEDPLIRQISLAMGLGEERGKPVEEPMAIEDAWALEDTREEAETPLVTRMFNGEGILGCDAQSQTFYCALGLDNPDGWPALSLSALGAQGVRVAWIDDYSYDAVEDALSEGYRYELLAYTDTQYAYIGVVFTGLPIVTLHTDGAAAIVKEPSVDADVHIASAQQEALASRAQVHTRGGDCYEGVDKPSYRFELRGINAKGNECRAERGVLGMPADSDWLLVSNASDRTAVRNHLCWALWRDWQPGRQLAELESRLVEVFVNDSYKGIYQLMQYVDPARELAAIGGNPETDVCVRRIVMQNGGDRPRLVRDPVEGHVLELRYAPPGMPTDEAFAAFDAYTQLELHCDELDDEAFAALLAAHFDIPSLLEYYLFVQGYNLRDNVRNNLYIWALRQEDGSYRYALSPWDMDRSLSLMTSDEQEGMIDTAVLLDEHAQESKGWFRREMRFVERMLELDVDGSRRTLWALWTDKRAHQLSEDTLYQQITALEEEVNASGAYLRESERWRGGAEQLNLAEMSANMPEVEKWVELVFRETWPADNMPDWW